MQEDSCGAEECAVNLLQKKAVVRRTVVNASSPTALQQQENRVGVHQPLVTIPLPNGAIVIEDQFYLDLLQSVKTYSGKSLFDEVAFKPFYPNLVTGLLKEWKEQYENTFPNTALYTFGSPNAGGLLVYAPGTDMLCMTYYHILVAIALELDYYVVCPQMTHTPISQETVMKVVFGVEWALHYSEYNVITVGGHSGGASAAAAAVRVLLSKSIQVDALLMWHPGVVNYYNAPGCAELCSVPGPDNTCTAADKHYCEEYYPSNLAEQISSVKMLAISGNFCDWSKVQNSNWIFYACHERDDSCTNKTIPTPSYRPDQPPFTCEKGCPNAAFIDHPGDCMKATWTVQLKEAYWKTWLGDALLIESCGEHAYAASVFAYDEEARPYIIPFLKALVADAAEATSLIEKIKEKHGTTVTCQTRLNLNELCLFPQTPYTQLLNPYYAEANGTVRDCLDAPAVFATGIAQVYSKQVGVTWR